MTRVSSQAALPSSLAGPLVSSDILTTSLLKVFVWTHSISHSTNDSTKTKKAATLLHLRVCITQVPLGFLWTASEHPPLPPEPLFGLLPLDLLSFASRTLLH